jgi:hypothetical protein
MNHPEGHVAGVSEPRRPVIGVPLARCGLAILPGLPAQLAPAATSGLPTTSGVGTQRVNVIVIDFDPVLETRPDLRLHEHFKWSDPGQLTERMLADAREGSGGYVDYRVALP